GYSFLQHLQPLAPYLKPDIHTDRSEIGTRPRYTGYIAKRNRICNGPNYGDRVGRSLHTCSELVAQHQDNIGLRTRHFLSKIAVALRSSLGRVSFDNQISAFSVAKFAELAKQRTIGRKVTDLGYFRGRNRGGNNCKPWHPIRCAHSERPRRRA